MLSQHYHHPMYGPVSESGTEIATIVALSATIAPFLIRSTGTITIIALFQPTLKPLNMFVLLSLTFVIKAEDNFKIIERW